MAILFEGANVVFAMGPRQTRLSFRASTFPAVCQALGSGLSSPAEDPVPSRASHWGAKTQRAEGTSPSLSHTTMALESGAQAFTQPCLQVEARVVWHSFPLKDHAGHLHWKEDVVGPSAPGLAG